MTHTNKGSADAADQAGAEAVAMATPGSHRGPSCQEHPPPAPPPELRMTSKEKMPPRSTAKESPFQWRPCANPGNPVFSCMLDAKTLTTNNFLTKPQLLLYRTTSCDYGNIPPTSQMVPYKFYPRDNSFTNHLFACGLTGFNCINTGVDRSKVYDHPDVMNLL